MSYHLSYDFARIKKQKSFVITAYSVFVWRWLWIINFFPLKLLWRLSVNESWTLSIIILQIKLKRYEKLKLLKLPPLAVILRWCWTTEKNLILCTIQFRYDETKWVRGLRNKKEKWRKSKSSSVKQLYTILCTCFWYQRSACCVHLKHSSCFLFAKFCALKVKIKRAKNPLDFIN